MGDCLKSKAKRCNVAASLTSGGFSFGSADIFRKMPVVVDLECTLAGDPESEPKIHRPPKPTIMMLLVFEQEKKNPRLDFSPHSALIIDFMVVFL